MIYRDFADKKLSLLGFGTMRLPTLPDGSVDGALTQQMVDLALENGVNYFDTAYPYMGGMSEIFVGKALSKHPRGSYYLADKYPGHQIAEEYKPAEIFEEQLKKCGVDYFDFYLLHNVYESSAEVYLDPKWGIIDYFKEQKRLGRIKHLGFSTHARNDSLEKFLDAVGKDMEFCQIQLNWLDWTLQDAKGKVELLNRHGIPIWVMEPVRGGMLCKLSDTDTAILNGLRDESVPAWGLRFLQGIDGVSMILSGMSNIAQMQENIATFAESKPLNATEAKVLLDIAEGMKDSVPCTACKYCTEGCPMGIDIPAMIATYNELRVDAKTNPTMWIEGLPEDKQPSACIGCGACEHICPQKIEIPKVMSALTEQLESIPKWKDICKERAEAAKRARENQ